MKKLTRMILFYVLVLFAFSFVSIPSSNAWSFSKSANLYGKSMPMHKLKKLNSVNVDSVIKSINVYFENDYFHYGEYYPNLGRFTALAGSYADGEHLGMHGYGISFQSILSKQIPVWYEAGYSYLPGSGIYDEPVGPTNFSHDTGMAKYGFRLGYVFNITNRIAVIPNFGYQFVNWNRDLPGVMNSDYYHLNYYMLGVKGYYIPPVLNNKLWIEGSAYYLNDIHDTVDIGVTGTYTINPGTTIYSKLTFNNFIMTPKAGYIIGAKIGYKLLQINYKNNPILSVSPYVGVTFEQNKMGASSVNSLDTYFEPSDQYNQIFLKFGLKFGF
ncbi:MAG TPA: hypothetical protein ENI54_04070 [bacterium]|nr:hypothetical protein [bacterium]